MLCSHCTCFKNTDKVVFKFLLFLLLLNIDFFSYIYSFTTDQVFFLLLVLRFCFSSFSSFCSVCMAPFLFCLCSCMGRDGKNWNHRAVTQVGFSLIRI